MRQNSLKLSTHLPYIENAKLRRKANLKESKFRMVILMYTFVELEV